MGLSTRIQIRGIVLSRTLNLLFYMYKFDCISYKQLSNLLSMVISLHEDKGIVDNNTSFKENWWILNAGNFTITLKNILVFKYEIH